MLLKYHFPVKETRKFCGKGGSAVGMCENGIPTHTDKKKTIKFQLSKRLRSQFQVAPTTLMMGQSGFPKN